MALLTAAAGLPIGRLLSVFILAHFSHHLSVGILPPILPLVRDGFHLSYLQAGVLISAFSVAYGTSQVPLGPIADRTSPRAVVSIGLLGVGLVTFVIGLSSGYEQLLILLVLLGIFGGTYHAPALALVARYFPVAVRGRAVGMHMVGGSAGFLVTPIAAGLIASVAGWRVAFISLAIPTVLTGLVFWRLTRRPVDAQTATGKRTPEKLDLGWLLQTIGGVGVLVTLFQIVSSSVNAFLSIYLVDRFQLDVSLAAAVVGLMWGAGIVSGPVAGGLSDRFGRKPVIAATLIATGPLLLLVTRLDWGIPLIIAIAVFGAVLTMRTPVMESLIIDAVPDHRRSSAMGVFYFFNHEIGGLVAPILGFAIDRVGLHPAFTGLAVLACLVSAATLLLRKKL